MHLIFETLRLRVFEVSSELSEHRRNYLFIRIQALFTPCVVEHLPPYFKGINSLQDARRWFEHMVVESHFYVVEHKDKECVIGFVFIHPDEENLAHIAYVLGETYWRQGFANEILMKLIEFSKHETTWSKLVGGVDPSNKTSSHLLEKLGFERQPSAEGAVVFYEYDVS